MYHLRDAAPIERSELKSTGDGVSLPFYRGGTADHVGILMSATVKFIQSARRPGNESHSLNEGTGNVVCRRPRADDAWKQFANILSCRFNDKDNFFFARHRSICYPIARARGYCACTNSNNKEKQCRSNYLHYRMPKCSLAPHIFLLRRWNITMA